MRNITTVEFPFFPNKSSLVCEDFLFEKYFNCRAPTTIKNLIKCKIKIGSKFLRPLLGEIFNASDFALSHSYCSASRIYEMNLQLDIAEVMKTRCLELLDLALKSVDLDLNGNGIIDDGETNLEKAGGKRTDFRASWKSYQPSDYEKTFQPTRAMRH